MQGAPGRTTVAAMGQGATAAPGSHSAPPSFAPVGLEMADTDLEESPRPIQQTGSLRIPLRRRRLGGIVIATVAGCTLILVAAVIARVSHASSLRRDSASVAPIAKPSPAPAQVAASVPSSPGSSGGPAQPVAAAAPPPELPVTGTVRLQRPATPGRVWLDGKKLNLGSAIVSCGAHQVKIGRGRARAIDVPCGGEFVVSK